MELEELLELLTEQQKELLLLADQQREVWARSLDSSFQHILRRYGGSGSKGPEESSGTESMEEKVSDSKLDKKSLPKSDAGREFPPPADGLNAKIGAQMQQLIRCNPTLKPQALVEDDWPSDKSEVEAPLSTEEQLTAVEAQPYEHFSAPFEDIEEEIKMDDSQGADSENGLKARGRATSDQSFAIRFASAAASPTSNNVMMGLVTGDSKELEETRCGRCFQFVMTYLDAAASFFVFLNALVMLLEFEMSGRRTGSLLGLNDGAFYHDRTGLFQGLGLTFDILFSIELSLRITAEGRLFLKDAANFFDSCLVLAGLAEHFLLLVLPNDPLSSQLMRALSSVRAVRMLRAFRFSQGLKLLLNACQAFLMSLVWSMVLLGVVMVVASLMIGNLLQDYLRNDQVNLEDREFIWRFYGTAYRSWYTLYEITFAGNWPTMARPVLDKVSHGFVIFFVLYITVIVFALIRVITAVFLKDTLDAANNDAELRMAEGLRKKAEYVEKLEGIFKAIDDGGDGMITEERLTYILDNPKVKAYFQTLDVDVHEGAALFQILDDGDGECTLEEFIGGILRCKGPARAIDQVAMMADLRLLHKKLSKLCYALQECNVIGTLESGEFQKINSLKSPEESLEVESMPMSKVHSKRRMSDAAQTFLYRTAMLPKLKHGASTQIQDDTTMLM